MFNILSTLKRVMRDNTSHRGVYSFTHYLKMYKTHSISMWFYQLRSSDLEDGVIKG